MAGGIICCALKADGKRCTYNATVFGIGAGWVESEKMYVGQKVPMCKQHSRKKDNAVIRQTELYNG